MPKFVYDFSEGGKDEKDLLGGKGANLAEMTRLGSDSGTGVCFTRDPASGRQGHYGDYLPNAQGEDVVAGIRNTPLPQRRRESPPVANAASARPLHRAVPPPSGDRLDVGQVDHDAFPHAPRRRGGNPVPAGLRELDEDADGRDVPAAAAAGRQAADERSVDPVHGVERKVGRCEQVRLGTSGHVCP